jgi:hypothetical protein
MSHINCPQEAAVTRAIRAGILDESLATHAATCPVCRDVVTVSHSMHALARGPENNRALPDASLVWWKAQLSEQQTRVERAQTILEWLQIAFAAIGSLGLAAWVAWNWAAMQEWLTSSLGSAQLMFATYSTSTLFLPIIAILCLAALLVAYPMITDV